MTFEMSDQILMWPDMPTRICSHPPSDPKARRKFAPPGEAKQAKTSWIRDIRGSPNLSPDVAQERDNGDIRSWQCRRRLKSHEISTEPVDTVY